MEEVCARSELLTKDVPTNRLHGDTVQHFWASVNGEGCFCSQKLFSQIFHFFDCAVSLPIFY